MISPTYTRFQDIPRFIEGDYRCDVSLRFLTQQLEYYRENYGLDLDPDFQRAHVWTEAQQVAFVEHVLRGGKNTVIRFNCAGWNRKSNAGPMQVVDGKQRLTALLAFLANEIPAFGTYLKDFEGIMSWIGMGVQFVVNDLAKREDVLRWYLEINEGNVAHTAEELDRVREMLSTEVYK